MRHPPKGATPAGDGGRATNDATATWYARTHQQQWDQTSRHPHYEARPRSPWCIPMLEMRGEIDRAYREGRWGDAYVLERVEVAKWRELGEGDSDA